MARVIRLTDLAEINALRLEWENLLARTGNRSVFMTWEWLVTWWEIYGEGRELWWLVVKDEKDRLIGGAPFYRRWRQSGLLPPRQELRFVGTGASVSPEHLDVVADAARSEECLQSLSRFLGEHASDWDLLTLTDVSDPNAHVYRLFKVLAGEEAVTVAEEQLPRAPFVALPDSWQAYCQSLSPKMRVHISRHRRKTARELGVHFERWSAEKSDFDSALHEFEKLFAARKESVGIGNKFEKAKGYRAFHRRLAERFARRGWLDLVFLRNGGGALAAEYGFQYEGILSNYQFGFDPGFARNNVFKVLRSYLLEDAIGRGLKEFDLLRGEEPYKYDWSAVPRSKKCFRCFSPNFYGRTLHGLLKLGRMGRRVMEGIRL